MGKMGGVTNRQNGKCDIWGKWVRAHRSRAQFVLGGHVRLDGSRGGRVLRVCWGRCGGGGLGMGRGLAAGGVRWLLVEWVGESGCWRSLLGRVMVWGGAGRSLLGVVREVLWGWGSERDFAL